MATAEKTSVIRMIEAETGVDSRMSEALIKLLETGTFRINEVFAIARACSYAKLIPDESIGSIWKDELHTMMAPHSMKRCTWMTGWCDACQLTHTR